MVKVVSKKNENKLPNQVGQDLRYERKFIFPNIHLDDLIQRLNLNSFCFSEIFHERKINNVYFDDHNLSFYRQNVIGVGNRFKYRLRWYGNDFSKVNSPVIEIKRKYGLLGDKARHKLENFNLTIGDNGISELHKKLMLELDKNLFYKNKFYQLQASLLNAYRRRYFLSFCGRFRITLDYNQEFFNPNYRNYKASRRTIEERGIVLELKYSMQNDSDARLISQELGARLSKNSKYITGIDLNLGLNS